jgi:hypothetical protein
MAKKVKEYSEEQKPKNDDELYDKLYSYIEEAKANSSVWENKATDFYKLRMRDKKTKTFPFPGCSNLRLPTIETYLRKAKSSLLALYTNVKPRCMVIPQQMQSLENANNVEKFLDWMVDVKMNMLNTLIVITDQMLQHGLGIAKIVWKMEDNQYTETINIKDLSVQEVTALFDPNIPDEALTQFAVKKFNVDMSETVMADNMEALTNALTELRSGKTSVKMTLRDELYNAPELVACDPTYVYVPADSGIDVQKLAWIGHEYFERYDCLKARATYGSLEKSALDDIEALSSLDLQDERNVNFTKDLREGIDRINNPSQLVRVIDLYCHYDLDDDGVNEKCHFLLAPDFQVVLKKQRLENDSQKFPFVRFQTEIIDDRWFSPRGFPEHLQDLSKEIDAQHNQKIDSQTIRNAPIFTFRSGIVNPKLVKFIPGQGIPVPGTTPLNDALQIMNNNNQGIEFSYEREELLLKTVIQEYLGQMDYSVQSMINKRQPRTLGEVQMQSQAANMVFSLDASMYANSLTEVFTQILELCQQYMPEQIFTLIVGQDGVQPLRLTRDEIQGKYNIFCRGNDINSNPQLRAQKAFARVQVLLNPQLGMTGVVSPMNVFNVLKNYLQADGELAWQTMITPPQPPPPPPPPVKVGMEDLEDGEKAQVLTRMGIKPDMMGRQLKSAAMIQEKSMEQETQKVDNLSKIVDAIGGLDDEGSEIGGSQDIA